MTNTDTEHTSDAPIHDVIIVGSGPPGTAAVYAARAEMSPVLFEGTQFGGALMTTTEVENYPGFREGYPGTRPDGRMREQALRFGADLRMEDVDALRLDGPVKEVEVAGDVHRARAVILAMGRPHATSASPASRNCWAAVCHPAPPATGSSSGSGHRGHRRRRLGDGGGHLPHQVRAQRHPHPPPRGVPLVQDHARTRPCQREDPLRHQCHRRQVLGENSVTGLELIDTVTGATSTLDVTGMFVAIGHDPRSELVRGQVDLDDEGYVQVQGRSTHTSLPGVFACGDLVDHTYRQAITAAGSGYAAAIDTERWRRSAHLTRTTPHSRTQHSRTPIRWPLPPSASEPDTPETSHPNPRSP